MNLDRPFWEISYSKTDAPTTFNKGKLNWIIHHKSSHTFEDDHDGGIHHVHAANRVIAQKPANLPVKRTRLARC